MAKRNGAAAAGSDVAEPEADGFGRLLFAYVPAEDLATYDPADLERIGAAAHAALARARAASCALISLRDETVTIRGARRQVTIIEVINDNMPFLLDSTLAELSEQGLELHLVAHPILAVARDGTGAFARLAGDAGARPVATGAPRRSHGSLPSSTARTMKT